MPRFRMFEMIRAFAQTGSSTAARRPSCARRHLSYFETLAAEAEPALRDVDHLHWMGRIAPEWENLRARVASRDRRSTRRQRAAPPRRLRLHAAVEARSPTRDVAADRGDVCDARDELDDNTHGRLLFAGHGGVVRRRRVRRVHEVHRGVRAAARRASTIR